MILRYVENPRRTMGRALNEPREMPQKLDQNENQIASPCLAVATQKLNTATPLAGGKTRNNNGKQFGNDP